MELKNAACQNSFYQKNYRGNTPISHTQLPVDVANNSCHGNAIQNQGKIHCMPSTNLKTLRSKTLKQFKLDSLQ